MIYLHKIKNTYLNFAISQKLAAKTSILIALGVIVKLGDNA